MPAGRPTPYNIAVLDKVKRYLALCKDQEVQLVKQSGENKAGGYQMFENKLVVRLPSIEGLAKYLKVHRDTLYEWEAKHPAFSDILEQVRHHQADRLINNGLSGDYNPTIAKLLLGKHGYTDKAEFTGKDGGPIQVQGVEIAVRR